MAPKKPKFRYVTVDLDADGMLDLSGLGLGNAPRDSAAAVDAIAATAAVTAPLEGLVQRPFVRESEANTSSDSEFPSLSGGGPQSQSSANMADWSTPSIRGAQAPSQNPVQRPGASQPRDASSQPPESNSSFSQGFDSQFDVHRATSQSEANQMRSTTTDDFPPLGGGLNGNSRHEGQADVAPGSNNASAIGGNAFGNPSGTHFQPFAGQQSDRPMLGENRFGENRLGTLGSPAEVFRSMSAVSDRMNRTSPRQGPNDYTPSLNNPPRSFAELGWGLPRSQQNPPGQASATQDLQQGSSFANPMLDATANQQQPRPPKRLAEMTESEKFGLEGLRAMLPGRPDHNPFVMGQDLDSLGIDFSR